MILDRIMKTKYLQEPSGPVNILAVADEEVPKFHEKHDKYKKDEYEGIDLILSCGDLSYHYLNYIADVAHCNVYNVFGNHDELFPEDEPLGCIPIDGKFIVVKNIRILGLGGSMKYRECKKHQYKEEEMVKRVKKLRKSIDKAGGFDILVTHAPAFGINDGTDLCHTGFKVFKELIDEYSPKYFIHGHVHQNYGKFPKITQYKNTTIINAYRYHKFEYVFDEPEGL